MVSASSRRSEACDGQEMDSRGRRDEASKAEQSSSSRLRSRGRAL